MSTAKYLTVRTWLHDLIRNERISIGDRLPTEVELANKFGVNRMTVRKALDQLVQEKIIERRQGVGTFLVAKAPVVLLHSSGRIISILNHLQIYGIPSSVKNLKIIHEIPPARERELLEIDDRTAVVRIDRVISISNEPMILATSYLAPRFSGIIDMDLSQPLYDLITNGFNVVLHHSDEAYWAAMASEEELDAFTGLYSGPFIRLENVLYEMNNQPIGVFNALFRGDRFKFRAHAMEFLGNRP